MNVSVVIEPRENCIMCCNCHSNCPEIFETSDVDGKSQIREEHRVDDEIDKGAVDKALEDCQNSLRSLSSVNNICRIMKCIHKTLVVTSVHKVFTRVSTIFYNFSPLFVKFLKKFGIFRKIF